jgi:hypothetical protein
VNDTPRPDLPIEVKIHARLVAEADADGRVEWERLCRLHDQPRPPARRHAEPGRSPSRSPHRGLSRTTRTCVPSHPIMRWVAPAAACQPRSTSSSTDKVARWSLRSRPARPANPRCSSHCCRTWRSSVWARPAAHPPGRGDQRQGLLLPRDPHRTAIPPRQGGHPAALGPDRSPQTTRVVGRAPTDIRRRDLQGPQRHRAVLQRAQAVARSGNPLRQARRGLPRRRRPTRDRHLASRIRRHALVGVPVHAELRSPTSSTMPKSEDPVCLVAPNSETTTPLTCESPHRREISASSSTAGTAVHTHPFVRTKTADELLTKANLPTTSHPRH